MTKKPWHYQSVKSAIQMFIDEHEPQAFLSKSIEEEVAKNYHILTVGTEYGNHNRQQRQRHMTGVIIQAVPAAVENWYVRKTAPRLGIENWDGHLILEGRDYYCRIDTQEE